MEYVCFYLLANIFMVYGYYCFFNAYFGCPPINKRLGFLYCTLFFILTSFMFLLIKIPQITILSNLLSIFLIASLYTGSIRTRLLAGISSYALAMMLEVVSYTLFNSLKIKDNLEAALGTLFPAMGLFTLSLILKKIQTPKHPDRLNLLNWLAIFLLSMGSILIMIFTLFISNRQWTTFITALVLVITNVVVFHLLDVFERYYQSQNATQLFKQQSQAYANELMLIRQNDQKISTMQHDLKNHLTAIRHFAETGEMEKLTSYLDTFTDNMAQTQEYVHSGNLELDAILNYKLEAAARAGAAIESSVILPEQLNLNFFDINIMLGNLLDNAITGLETSSEKKLSIEMGFQMGVLYVKVENSYDGVVKKDSGRYLTRKKDKDSHGLGLSSVEQIVEKYQGQIHVDSSDHVFKVGIILYLPS